MPAIIRDIFDGEAPVSQRFGENLVGYAHLGIKGHDGIDFAMAEGRALRAGVHGQVVSILDGFSGKTVVIRDLVQRIRTVHTHMSSFAVTQGAIVTPTTIIGRSGATGRVTGPHLHYGVSKIDEQGRVLNRDNGYDGYIDPFDANNVTWVLGEPARIPEVPAVPAKPATPAGLTFEQAYPVLYKGWPEAEARADFAITGGKNKAGYEQLVGLPPPGPSEPAPPPPDLSIPGQIELNTGNAMAFFGQNKPGVYGRNKATGEWLWTTTPISTFSSIGLGHWRSNDQVEWASKGGWEFEERDGDNFTGAGEGRRRAAEIFKSVGGNTGSINVWAPPPPPIPPPPPPKEPERPIPTLPPGEVESPDLDRITRTTPPPPVSPPPSGDFTEILRKLDQILALLSAQPTPPGTVTPTPTPTPRGTGFMYITSSPARASVYLDGNFVRDFTPFNVPIPVATGPHLLSIRKRDYVAQTESIQIVAGEQFTKDYTLDPKV